MEVLYWIIIMILFAVSFIGLFYPVIPSVLFLIGGFLLYGLFFSFSSLNWLFWTIQLFFLLLLFSADYLSNLIGIKKFGGSKAGIWGSTIGLLVGPFIIPVVGILLGPFIGAVIGELLVNKTSFKAAIKIGVGSLVGFISSIITKGFNTIDYDRLLSFCRIITKDIFFINLMKNRATYLIALHKFVNLNLKKLNL